VSIEKMKKIDNYFPKKEISSIPLPLKVITEKQDIPEENKEKIQKCFDRNSFKTSPHKPSQFHQSDFMSQLLSSIENVEITKKKQVTMENSIPTNHFDLRASDSEGKKPKVEDKKSKFQYKIVILDYKFDIQNNLSIEVTQDDIDTLKSTNLLNDTIITFYLKFLENYFCQTSPKLIYCFNTHFSVFLKNEFVDDIEGSLKRYKKLNKWGKHIDILNCKYVAIPIHDSNHWSLVIIISPGKIKDLFHKVVSKSDLKIEEPSILYLDSFYNGNESCVKSIKRFLIMEFRRKADEIQFAREVIESPAIIREVEAKIKDYSPKVPVQTNTYDCGVYVLAYCELFFYNPAFLIKRLDDVDVNVESLLDWFKSKFVEEKREFIKSLLTQLSSNSMHKEFFENYLKKSEFLFSKYYTEEKAKENQICEEPEVKEENEQ
jgi:Ulp1 family protease